jgi:hypothetical protein
MTSAGRSSSARSQHLGSVSLCDQLFEKREVLLLGIVLDGVERGEALGGIVGGELKLHQRGGDHALHAAIGAKLRDLAAAGGADDRRRW